MVTLPVRIPKIPSVIIEQPRLLPLPLEVVCFAAAGNPTLPGVPLFHHRGPLLLVSRQQWSVTPEILAWRDLSATGSKD